MAGATGPRTRARTFGPIGAATVATLLVGCGPTVTSTPTSPPSEAPPAAGAVTSAAIEHLGAVPCPEERAFELHAPTAEGLLCGTLSVPLDHADPGGPTLELDVVLRDEDRPAGVLALLGGRPGGSIGWAVAVLPHLMPEVATEYQFVAIDPRGTGADVLDCPMVLYKLK